VDGSESLPFVVNVISPIASKVVHINPERPQ
jgi:hypothetical protein